MAIPEWMEGREPLPEWMQERLRDTQDTLDARAIKARDAAEARREERRRLAEEEQHMMDELASAVREYDVTLTNGAFVFRYRVQALDDDQARFTFMRRWTGMMISQDTRPSELKVERVD